MWQQVLKLWVEGMAAKINNPVHKVEITRAYQPDTCQRPRRRGKNSMNSTNSIYSLDPCLLLYIILASESVLHQSMHTDKSSPTLHSLPQGWLICIKRTIKVQVLLAGSLHTALFLSSHLVLCHMLFGHNESDDQIWMPPFCLLLPLLEFFRNPENIPKGVRNA